ncbi:hypothetical protein CH530_02860 [Salmonella enterica subsp. enterica serovar Kentucky]|nr:hypothetical protein [Salmonella enterica subsp. enterica serovar Kentucky]
MSIKNDGHYFCRAGGNRPDGLNEPVTFIVIFHALRGIVTVRSVAADGSACALRILRAGNKKRIIELIS